MLTTSVSRSTRRNFLQVGSVGLLGLTLQRYLSQRADESATHHRFRANLRMPPVSTAALSLDGGDVPE
jgi:hypothetical protein